MNYLPIVVDYHTTRETKVGVWTLALDKLPWNDNIKSEI